MYSTKKLSLQKLRYPLKGRTGESIFSFCTSRSDVPKGQGPAKIQNLLLGLISMSERFSSEHRKT